MENIYTCNKEIKIELLCRKSYGDSNDKLGRYFEKGKKYMAKTEIYGTSTDTNHKPFRSVWVSFNAGFGSRFAIIGNIYYNKKPYWNDFKDIFHCPNDLIRRNKINKLMKVI